MGGDCCELCGKYIKRTITVSRRLTLSVVTKSLVPNSFNGVTRTPFVSIYPWGWYIGSAMTSSLTYDPCVHGSFMKHTHVLILSSLVLMSAWPGRKIICMKGSWAAIYSDGLSFL